jgi:hypothetical protein
MEPYGGIQCGEIFRVPAARAPSAKSDLVPDGSFLLPDTALMVVVCISILAAFGAVTCLPPTQQYTADDAGF